MKSGYSFALIALSVVISLSPIPAKAQDTGNTISTSPLQSIASPILNGLLNTYTTQQMEKQFLQSHPNFQQENPAGYNMMITDPQDFFSQQNWQNYQYQSGGVLQQMVQQFLQTHPNFQQENPSGFNTLLNNPQIFFNQGTYQGYGQNYQCQQNYQYQSGGVLQQKVQQFLQRHPNFQQENPAGYNQMMNDPQDFFANMHHRRDGQNWQNQGYHNNNWSNPYQSQYGQGSYRNY